MVRTLLRGGAALLVAGSLGLVAFGGIAYLHARAEARPDPEQRPPLPVATLTAERQQSYATTEFYTGRVEARAETALAFELPGLVTDILAEEGDRIAAGTPIALLDTDLLRDEKRRLEADRRALEADMAFAEKTERRQQSLERKGFAATAALDQAESAVRSLRARILSTEAAIAGVDTRLAKSTLVAPFDGVISVRRVDPGAVLEAGMPVATLMAVARPELRIGIAPETAKSLRPGDRVDAAVGRRSYTATVRSVIPQVSPVTRTVDVLFDLEGDQTPEIGQTATISLPRTRDQAGFWLPRGALSEGARGLWSVLVVDESGDVPVAVREVVRIIHAEADKVYVEGSLASGARVVAEGTHRLAPGQPLAVRPAE
ncbi:MAG: efflux RND transporter periplasmic adaptor subunit [Alphaproteobacteria bacterium]|nr:efflux RND transporter periplasmic adaptor subunit [Alphaproteobacteria bacterium]